MCAPCGDRRGDDELRVAGNHVEQRRRGAFVGDVRELDAGELVEHLARQVRRRADAGRGVVQHAGLAARELHQLADRCGRQRAVDHQHVRRRGDARQRSEVAHRVERQVLPQVGQDGVDRGGGHQQGVAIGRGARGDLGAERAAGPGLVVHDDLLAQCLGQLLRQDARQLVRRAARGIGDDQADRPGGEGLRRGVRAGGQQGEGSRSRNRRRDGVMACLLS